MPNVKIELLEGRTTEQKAAVAKAVTEAAREPRQQQPRSRRHVRRCRSSSKGPIAMTAIVAARTLESQGTARAPYRQLCPLAFFRSIQTPLQPCHRAS